MYYTVECVLDFGTCSWIIFFATNVTEHCYLSVLLTERRKANLSGTIKRVHSREEISKDKNHIHESPKNVDIRDTHKDGISIGKQEQSFTFQELVDATGNFRSDCLLGEGGFGKVYKGHLEKINQVPHRQIIIKVISSIV